MAQRRRDEAVLQRFGRLDAPTFDKEPTCSHERKKLDYPEFLRACEPLVVGEWPLVAPEAQSAESTPEPGPSRRDLQCRPISIHSTARTRHRYLGRCRSQADVDRARRVPRTLAPRRQVRRRPLPARAGRGCDACHEKWMLADFLTQFLVRRHGRAPETRAVSMPTRSAQAEQGTSTKQKVEYPAPDACVPSSGHREACGPCVSCRSHPDSSSSSSFPSFSFSFCSCSSVLAHRLDHVEIETGASSSGAIQLAQLDGGGLGQSWKTSSHR